MSEIVYFIKENMEKIIIVVVVVFLLLVLINIKGFDLNEKKPETKLKQQVTIETFDNIDDTENITQQFCKSYLGDSKGLENACNELTRDNCANVKCCVFMNDKCLAGGQEGPTYKTDKEGKLITADSYYYMGKCRGRNCN